jgi:CheY-like chemotaxis protein/DNA-directed RNA polymerase specialized sigma24 family protein
MSLAYEIAPHLPFLRRFSRSITGDQNSGDAYVVALLNTFIADPDSFDRSLDVRLSLYRSFCKLWESVSLNLLRDINAPDWEVASHRNLQVVSPLARQTFLLAAVEGFTIEQISEILKRPPIDIRNLIDEASQQLALQVATQVLIIEDEPLIAIDLESLLDDLGHQVTGVARTEKEALELAEISMPGLVLADIQLADGSSGIDAVNTMLGKFEVPVIFITAFPERLLTGKRPEPTFLITKPFEPEMLKAIVSQALYFDTKSRQAA